jgi:alpha-L-rhamnosidase
MSFSLIGKFFVTAAVALAGVTAAVLDLSPRQPSGLMCELLAAPEIAVIADAAPEFSWIVNSAEAGDYQTAYRIRVTAGDKPVWDSGRVESDHSVSIEYGGSPLAANGAYEWQVKLWTKRAGESPWSEPQRFTMAKEPTAYATSGYPLVQTPVAPVVVLKKGEGHFLIDFGRVAFGYLTLELDAPVTTELEIHLAERGSPEGVNRSPGGTVRYVEVKQPVRPGLHTYRVRPPRDERNTGKDAIQLPQEIGVIMPFRYCEIMDCPVELTAAMIRQLAVHYPFDEGASSLTSSDEMLNKVWDLCKYSMKATSYCGVYVDGDRERIPYEADAYINQLSHYAVDREFTLARRSHEYLLTHPTWPTEWKLHSVMMAGADYMYTGDNESLAQSYTLLKSQKTLEQFAREDGLLDTTGLRDIVDWPAGERDEYDFRAVNTVVNAFHFESLNLMRQFATVLGKSEDADSYRERASRLYQAFNAKLFDAERGVYIDGEGSDHASLHANMMVLAFGLVPEDRLQTVCDHVVSRGMACSPYGAQYLLEGLYRAGRAHAAFALLTSKDLRSWYNMIRVGSTITMEAWDDRFKPNQDWNHAWGAAPANIITRYLLGVRPLEAGFRKVLVRPMLGPLENVHARIPTIRGTISLSIDNRPAAPFELILTIPANMTARVEVPLPERQGAVTVDGRRIPFETVAGFAVFENVGSGTRVFRTVSPSGSAATLTTADPLISAGTETPHVTSGEEKR